MKQPLLLCGLAMPGVNQAGAERAEEIIDLCHRLDELDDLQPLFTALAA